jgi:phenylalanyl-tRNA synthetase beta chain
LLPTSRKALSARPLVPVERDFAFLVDNTLTANTLVAAILQSGTTEISSARVFDHYQGKGIPEGKKSLAVVVSLQPQDKAFTEEDLERISGSVVKSVQEKTGGELR